MTYAPPDGIYTDPLFGWAKLVNNQGVIQLLDSALEYQGGGIYAGTQTIIPVPEPGSLALLGACGLVLAWRFRRQRPWPLAAGSTNASWAVTVYNPDGLLITQQPTNRYQMAGGSVSFYGGAVGSNSVAYQWAFNGTDLPGATNATLALANVQAAQAGDYHFVASSAGHSLTSSNASLSRVTIPTITARTLPTNIVCLEGAQVGLAATADAPGQTHGFPLACQWQLNGTNLSGATGKALDFFATDASPGVYTLIVSNAAGATNVSWSVTVTNAINVTNDLLLIYNTNSVDSSNVCAYYLAHRPMVGGANVLPIGCTTNETFLTNEYTTDFTAQVQNWLTQHPTKRPQYVILFPDIPSRVNWFSNAPPGVYWMTGVTANVQCRLHTFSETWHPFVSSINLSNAVDCMKYVDKLHDFGTTYSPGKLIISASVGTYANTNFILDNVRHGMGWPYLEPDYSGFGDVISIGIGAIQGVGTPGLGINYLDGIETNGLALPPHITNAVNVAGYACWGFHSQLGSFYPVDRKVTWSGSSSWYVLKTEESHNGMRFADCGNFLQWFSSSAFGGTDYSNTPVGAVSFTDEPGVGAVRTADYFQRWASGKTLAISAWNASENPHLQVVGDPLVTR